MKWFSWKELCLLQPRQPSWKILEASASSNTIRSQGAHIQHWSLNKQVLSHLAPTPFPNALDNTLFDNTLPMWLAYSCCQKPYFCCFHLSKNLERLVRRDQVSIGFAAWQFSPQKEGDCCIWGNSERFRANQVIALKWQDQLQCKDCLPVKKNEWTNEWMKKKKEREKNHSNQIWLKTSNSSVTTTIIFPILLFSADVKWNWAQRLQSWQSNHCS